MKYLTTAILLLALVVTEYSHAGEIKARIDHEGSNTVVSCTPLGIEGDIVRALITLYKSDGRSITVTRDDMTVSSDKATYILPEAFLEIGGKCKFFIAEKSVFSVTSEYPPASNVTVAKADFYSSRE